MKNLGKYPWDGLAIRGGERCAHGAQILRTKIKAVRATTNCRCCPKGVLPPRRDPESPHLLGVDAEEVWFPSLDGIRLHGLWLPGRKDYPTLVLCLGYCKSLAEPLDVGLELNRAGYNLLSFDFRACGKSGGRHTTVGWKETWDVQAAAHYVAERHGRGPVRRPTCRRGASSARGCRTAGAGRCRPCGVRRSRTRRSCRTCGSGRRT